MRHVPALAFAAALAAVGPAAAQDVRNIASVNGWRAYTAETSSGQLCGMGTDANRVGRFLWIKVERLQGDLHGFVQIGDSGWNVQREARGRVVIAIDSQRAELNYTGTSRPNMIEASYRGAFDNFVNFIQAFAGGYRMQVMFPGEDVAPWSADLRGTRAITNAFIDCARRL